MVDYAQRYNEIVLGERPVNWGNIALIGLIALVVVGGGGFVLFNEDTPAPLVGADHSGSRANIRRTSSRCCPPLPT